MSVSVMPGPISGDRIMKQFSADATIDVGNAVKRKILAATALPPVRKFNAAHEWCELRDVPVRAGLRA